MSDGKKRKIGGGDGGAANANAPLPEAVGGGGAGQKPEAPEQKNSVAGVGGVAVTSLQGRGGKGRIVTTGRALHNNISSLEKHRERKKGKRTLVDIIEDTIDKNVRWTVNPMMHLGAPWFDLNLPMFTRSLLTQNAFYPVPRSATTQIMHVGNLLGPSPPANTESGTGGHYYMEGMFATPMNAGLTPGFRTTVTPLVGTLTLDMSCSFGAHSVAGGNAWPITQAQAQIHILCYDVNRMGTAPVGVNYNQDTNNQILSLLTDASDFEMAQGYDSYVRNMLQETASAAITSGNMTNVISEQEEVLYPKRLNYKIVYSSPIINIQPMQYATQLPGALGAGGAITNYEPCRFDITNLKIPINAQLDYAVGSLATLNRHIPDTQNFSCYHLAITVTPHIQTDSAQSTFKSAAAAPFNPQKLNDIYTLTANTRVAYSFNTQDSI